MGTLAGGAGSLRAATTASFGRFLLPLALIAAPACGDIVPTGGDGGPGGDGDGDQADAGLPCPERFTERVDDE